MLQCGLIIIIITIIKTTSAVTSWLVTVGVVNVGVADTTVSASQQQTLSGRGARVYTAHRGWLGVVMGISAA